MVIQRPYLKGDANECSRILECWKVYCLGILVSACVYPRASYWQMVLGQEGKEAALL